MKKYLCLGNLPFGILDLTYIGFADPVFLPMVEVVGADGDWLGRLTQSVVPTYGGAAVGVDVISSTHTHEGFGVYSFLSKQPDQIRALN